VRELETYADLLAGRRAHQDVELVVSTARDTLAEAEQRGIARRLRDAGAELLVDTCSYLVPVLRPRDGTSMTDSAKWAWYAPGNVGASVVIGSTRDCIESAVAGRIVRDERLWGDR
jgi:predicted aconitase